MWYPIKPLASNPGSTEKSGQSSRLIRKMIVGITLVTGVASLGGCVYYEPVPPPHPRPVYYYQSAPVVVPYAYPYGYGYRYR